MGLVLPAQCLKPVSRGRVSLTAESRGQAELEAAIALSKATALEEQMNKGGDDLPWWEVWSAV
jgi:hypothetical protein